MGHFQWVPNFYLFLVAPPGVVSKSTTLSIGVKLLEQVEGIHFGPEAMTWEALTQALGKSREDILMSVEGKDEFYPMSCLSIAAGELGTLINPHNRDLIDALVSLWDGKQGAWEKWTKASGSDKIINPWLNIASCTTPAWITQNFPEALIGGGFTSRCIFVYAEQKRQLIAYPHLHKPLDFGSLRDDLISDLGHIAETFLGPMTLSRGAVEWGTAWYEKHYLEKPDDIDLVRFGGYLARKQTHMHKTAMVLSAATRDDMVVTEVELQKALSLLEMVEPHMQKVFESIGIEGSGRFLAQVLTVLAGTPKLSKTALFKACARMMSPDEFDAAMVAGTRAELFTVYQAGQDIYVALRNPPEGIKDELPDVAVSKGS
jgi:hypothetical protein